MRARLLIGFLVAAVAFAAALVAWPRDHAQPSGATIGTNRLPMQSRTATYRLHLNGRAELVDASPAVPAADVTASPDGRYRVVGGTPVLSLVDERTHARSELARSPFPAWAFWSRQGLLAFSSFAGGFHRAVVLDPATGVRTVVASRLCGDGIADPWSPDGRSLALAISRPHAGCGGTLHAEVGVVDVAGGPVRRVTGPNTSFVTWTADGSHLLVSVRPVTGPSFGTSRLVDARTGSARAVLSSVGAPFDGTWSPGRRFYAARSGDPVSHAQIVVIVDGTFGRVLRSVRFGSAYAWSPRGQVLAVGTDRGVRMIDGTTGRDVAIIPARTPRSLEVATVRWEPDARSVLVVAAPAGIFHD